MAGGAEQQTMRVYLRVRPFSKEELADKEDQVQYIVPDVKCHPVYLVLNTVAKSHDNECDQRFFNPKRDPNLQLYTEHGDGNEVKMILLLYCSLSTLCT